MQASRCFVRNLTIAFRPNATNASRAGGVLADGGAIVANANDALAEGGAIVALAVNAVREPDSTAATVRSAQRLGSLRLK
jgi:hypothetical protein